MVRQGITMMKSPLDQNQKRLLPAMKQQHAGLSTSYLLLQRSGTESSSSAASGTNRSTANSRNSHGPIDLDEFDESSYHSDDDQNVKNDNDNSRSTKGLTSSFHIDYRRSTTGPVDLDDDEFPTDDDDDEEEVLDVALKEEEDFLVGWHSPAAVKILCNGTPSSHERGLSYRNNRSWNSSPIAMVNKNEVGTPKKIIPKLQRSKRDTPSHMRSVNNAKQQQQQQQKRTDNVHRNNNLDPKDSFIPVFLEEKDHEYTFSYCTSQRIATVSPSRDNHSSIIKTNTVKNMKRIEQEQKINNIRTVSPEKSSPQSSNKNNNSSSQDPPIKEKDRREFKSGSSEWKSILCQASLENTKNKSDGRFDKTTRNRPSGNGNSKKSRQGSLGIISPETPLKNERNHSFSSSSAPQSVANASSSSSEGPVSPSHYDRHRGNNDNSNSYDTSYDEDEFEKTLSEAYGPTQEDIHGPTYFLKRISECVALPNIVRSNTNHTTDGTTPSVTSSAMTEHIANLRTNVGVVLPQRVASLRANIQSNVNELPNHVASLRANIIASKGTGFIPPAFCGRPDNVVRDDDFD